MKPPLRPIQDPQAASSSRPEHSHFSIFPPWLHRTLSVEDTCQHTQQTIAEKQLFTVCQEAHCPNRNECFSRKHASFLAMGPFCTRSCGFCSVQYRAKPAPLNPNEPEEIAHAVLQLNLAHAVITQVTRDDLLDGGANHMAKIVRCIQKSSPQTSIEVLTSDFNANIEALYTVLQTGPTIFNHNVETVARLSPGVRHKATYERSLFVLKEAKRANLTAHIKSGLMVGLGETVPEVEQTLKDLAAVGCDIVTIGQYLQPHTHKLPVHAFIHPDQFEYYATFAKKCGFSHVHAAPFMRSSYTSLETRTM